MTQTAQRQAGSRRDWPFQAKPLHASFGVEIGGITLGEAVGEKVFDKVYEAFLDHQLILFRDVDLRPRPRWPSRGVSAKCRSTS